MGNLSFLTRSEIESLGPPTPEELEETDVSLGFLRELALKHVASLADPTTALVAEKLCLPLALTDELLYELYRERFIEIRLQSALGLTRYSMLDHGWQRVMQLQTQCGYLGPAPVSLGDYSYMIRLLATPTIRASMDTVRRAFHDLVLPESLLQTLGCVINSRSSLFLTGLPGTGKTAISERLNGAIAGTIWIPYAIEVDGQIVRVFDTHCHHQTTDGPTHEYDRRWIKVQRPMVVVGGELMMEHTDLTWSGSARFYEAPFHMKANGGTLVIDELGRQRVACHDLLNRWIVPLERRVDYLALHNGKKIEVPFEQLVVFSTNLNETEFVDEAFLRRMGYRARLELPTPGAFGEIFRRAAASRRLTVDEAITKYVLHKYGTEGRPMKSCEPRDLLNRIADICNFEGIPLQLSPELIDTAWANYFGTSHMFEKYPSPVRIQSAAG